MMLDPPRKKGPGRPKKLVPRKLIPKEGVVDFPSNYEEEKGGNSYLVNVIELVYDNPSMFCKIFHALRVMTVDYVRMLFDKNCVKMYANVHVGKNQIYVLIHGDKMNRYYCERPLEFNCKSSKVDEILSRSNKSFGRIIITTNRYYQKTKLSIILSNDELEEDSVDSIEIDEVTPYDWAIEGTLAKEIFYPISFDLPSKYLKKKVSDYHQSCETLRLEKEGYKDLHFSYTHKDKKGTHDSYFRNPGKINLISMLEEDDVFSTSVFLERIKPFSSTLISDEVHISADTSNDLIFTSWLDREEKLLTVNESERKKEVKCKLAGSEACVIKVVVEIVRLDR